MPGASGVETDPVAVRRGQARIEQVEKKRNVRDELFGCGVVVVVGSHDSHDVGFARQHQARVAPDTVERAGFVGNGDTGRNGCPQRRSFVGLQNAQGQLRVPAVQDLAAVKTFEQHRHFTRRRQVFLVGTLRFRIHHAPLQARVHQTLPVQERVHGLEAEAIEEEIGRGVVGQHDHEHRQIVQRELRAAIGEILQHTAAAGARLLADGNTVLEAQAALLCLVEQSQQNRDLDRAGLRKNVIRLHSEGVAGAQSLGIDAYDAVEPLAQRLQTALGLCREPIARAMLLRRGGNSKRGQNSAKYSREFSSHPAASGVSGTYVASVQSPCHRRVARASDDGTAVGKHGEAELTHLYAEQVVVAADLGSGGGQPGRQRRQVKPAAAFVDLHRIAPAQRHVRLRLALEESELVLHADRACRIPGHGQTLQAASPHLTTQQAAVSLPFDEQAERLRRGQRSGCRCGRIEHAGCVAGRPRVGSGRQQAGQARRVAGEHREHDPGGSKHATVNPGNAQPHGDVVDEEARLEIVGTVEDQSETREQVQCVVRTQVRYLGFDMHVAIGRLQFASRRSRLRQQLVGVVFVKQQLPRQIGEFHEIAVNDAQPADPRADHQLGQHAAKRPAAHQHHGSFPQLLLAGFADVRNQDLTRVPLTGFGIQNGLHRRFHLSAGGQNRYVRLAEACRSRAVRLTVSSRRALLCAAVAVAWAGLATGAIAQQQDFEGRRVSEVRVVTEEGRLLERNPRQLALQPGQPYRTEAEQTALKQLFRTGLYATIRTVVRPAGEALQVEFVVRENDFIGVVRLAGFKEPPSEARALATLGLGLGEPFSAATMEEALERLRQLFAEDGLFRAVLSVQLERDPATHEVNIVVNVQPGPRARVGTIHLVNHSRFSETVLLGRLGLRPGMPATADHLDGATERLRRFLVNKNYLTARVLLRRGSYDAATNRLPVEVIVDAGPAVRILVEGAHVAARELKKLVPIFQEGSVDEDLLLEGQRNLQDFFERQGFFDSRVRYEVRLQEQGHREWIVYEVQRGPRRRLAAVAFEGNHYFSTALLRERLRIQPAGLLSPGRFSPRLLEQDAEAIRLLYQANGFADVQVVPEVIENFRGHPRDLLVRFRIVEGLQTRVASLALEGNQAISTAELQDVLAELPGQPFSPTLVATDRDNILHLYYDRGYPRASFRYEVRSAGPNRVALTYRIEEGPVARVGRVILLGYRHTRPGVIRRQVQLKPGEPLRESDVVETQDRLYNLGVFNRVQIATQNPRGEATERTVLVEVREGQRYTIAYGGGFEAQRLGGASSAVGTTLSFSPRGIFEFTKLNVAGRAQTLAFKARASGFQYRGLVSYEMPGLLTNPRFNLLLSGFADKIRDVRTFTSRRYEASLQVAQNASRDTTFLYRFTFRRVLVDASSLRIDPNQIPLFSQPTKIAGFGWTWIRDRRDNPADATRGSFYTADLSLNARALGSSASFLRLFVQNSTFTPLGNGLVLARSTRFGVEQPYGGTRTHQIPLPERFFAGGGTTLRGFALNQAGPRDPVTGFPVGGLAELVFNQELRFPMRLPWVGSNVGGALFYDAGNVFSRLGAITLRTHPPSPTDLNYFSHTVGLGLRYQTPVGPVRFDIGYQLNPAQFQVPCTAGSPGCVNGHTLARLPALQFFFNFGSIF
jgi:outer membrane protein insertion porin family